MRIVVHGQQAFGKAVLEALLKRGDNVIAVYVAPEKPGAKPAAKKNAIRGRVLQTLHARSQVTVDMVAVGPGEGRAGR